MENRDFQQKQDSIIGLFDRVEIGPTASLKGINLSDFEALRYRLTKLGILDSPASSNYGPLHMALNLECLSSGVRGRAKAHLAFAYVGDQELRMTEQSTIKLNPLRFLREAGHGADWESAYDAKTNYIGPFPRDCSRLLDTQVTFMADIVDELYAQLGGALRSDIVSGDENVRVRIAELALDVEVNDSLRQNQLLAQSMLYDSCLFKRDFYRAGSETSTKSTVTKWWLKQGGPALKAYAKAPRLSRLEVVCDDRRAINSINDGVALRAEFSGRGTRKLLMNLFPSLQALLIKFHGHFEQVTGQYALPSALAQALSPLLAVMTGSPTGGRPIAQKSIEEANRAYDALCMTGMYCGTGLRSDATLKRVLGQLSSKAWPLIKHPTRHRYSLHPSLVSALPKQF